MTPPTGMTRFLAIHPAPASKTEDVEDLLARVATESHHLGVRPIETLYSPERGQAFSLFDAGDADDVREAFARAGVTDVDVVRGQRVHTELLHEPRRQRYA